MAHPGMSEALTVLSSGDLGVPDMAYYLEHPMGAVHMDKKEADVARATPTSDRLRSLALNAEDSVALIRRRRASRPASSTAPEHP